jgi:deoxyadenosine/deoxycytidine kinase
MIVEILGTIGIGKSTLLSWFPDESYVKVSEPVAENPWLEAFYAEYNYLTKLRAIGNTSPARTTPMMEMWLQAYRTNRIREAQEQAQHPTGNRHIVTDFGRPAVFAKMLRDDGIISRLDYETFLEVERATRVEADLTILLIDVDLAWANCRERARGCESGLTYEYLEHLESQYFKSCGNQAVVVSWRRDRMWATDAVNRILDGHGLPRI